MLLAFTMISKTLSGGRQVWRRPGFSKEFKYIKAQSGKLSQGTKTNKVAGIRRAVCVGMGLGVGGASPVALVVKNPSANAGDKRDVGLITGSGRSPGEGQGNQYSILAWRIPWTEEPGGLQSLGSQRVRHDWSNLAQTRGW